MFTLKKSKLPLTSFCPIFNVSWATIPPIAILFTFKTISFTSRQHNSRAYGRVHMVCNPDCARLYVRRRAGCSYVWIFRPYSTTKKLDLHFDVRIHALSLQCEKIRQRRSGSHLPRVVQGRMPGPFYYAVELSANVCIPGLMYTFLHLTCIVVVCILHLFPLTLTRRCPPIYSGREARTPTCITTMSKVISKTHGSSVHRHIDK